MASASRRRPSEGVEFVHEDGLVTARDIETGIASCGESKSEALSMLAEALELHEGGGDTVTDEDLREFGIDPERVDQDAADELPDVLQ